MAMQGNWNAAEVAQGEYHLEPDFPLRLRLLRRLGRQTWIPKGLDRLLRLIQDPDTCASYRFEVDFFGQRYRGDLAHYIDWLVFCYGSSALSELSVLEAVTAQIRNHRDGPVNFVDIGANAGHHTLFMARLADMVLAFEPFPALQTLIEEKIAINKLNNVRLLPFALGENDTEMDYYPGIGANSGSGTFLPDAEKRKNVPHKLTIRRGDTLFDNLKVDRIDLMKVDVEGFEPSVFRGLREHIRRDRPVILTEMSETSRKGFGNEQMFRDAFYDGAKFATVQGRNGCRFKLTTFVYESSDEILIMPLELGNFIDEHMT
jgi:FkbM family methyltransferase